MGPNIGRCSIYDRPGWVIIQRSLHFKRPVLTPRHGEVALAWGKLQWWYTPWRLYWRAWLFISIGLASAWRSPISPVLVASRAPGCLCHLVSLLNSGCAARSDTIYVGHWFLQRQRYYTSPSRQASLLQTMGTLRGLKWSLTLWALLSFQPWMGTSSFKFIASNNSWRERAIFRSVHIEKILWIPV